MKKIAIVLFVVSMLASFLVVSTSYAKTSENGNGLDEWVTGGGQILGPPGTQAYTFAGTIGKTSDGDIRGNMVVIDRFNNVSLRFIEFDSMKVEGNAATFDGTVQAYVNDIKENIQIWVRMTITDNGEPGAGLDRIDGYSDNGTFGGLAIQSDGKIVFAGYMHNGSNYDLAVYRFNANGTLDTTFSGDGMVNTGFGSGRNDYASDLVIQSGDKIVVSGYYCDGSDKNCNFAVARFNPNGSLDTTFSADGKQTTDFGGDDKGNSVIIQSNGKIVLAGCKAAPSDSSFALARYNTNGSLDTTFSADGKVLSNPNPGVNDWIFGLAIQSDGKLVVAGMTGESDVRDFILARYNSNGTLDNAFSGNGWLTTDFGGDDYASKIAIQTDGRLLVIGRTNVGAGADWDFALARYLP